MWRVEKADGGAAVHSAHAAVNNQGYLEFVSKEGDLLLLEASYAPGTWRTCIRKDGHGKDEQV